MKNILLKIKPIFLSFYSKKQVYERKFVRPGKDWRKIFVSFLVCTFVLAGLSFYFYKQIDKGEFFNSKDVKDNKEVKINETLIEKISTDLSKRESLFETLKNGLLSPEDPSL